LSSVYSYMAKSRMTQEKVEEPEETEDKSSYFPVKETSPHKVEWTRLARKEEEEGLTRLNARRML